MEIRNIPQIESYGRYRGEGYGAHCIKVTDVRGDEDWFSYTTLVAFRINGEFHMRQNAWGTTTGKHLNWISTEAKRETYEEFVDNLAKCLNERSAK